MGHWYDKEGNPVYQVTAKSGDMRDTTLRDARKMTLLPSVTTATGILSKPGLDIYKQNQAIMAALTLPRVEDETDEDLMKRIIADSKAHAQEAADIGTAIHRAIEMAWRGSECVTWGFIAHDVVDYVKVLTGIDDGWEPEVSFAEIGGGLGYGGKVDLINREAKIVIDYKTTETHFDKNGKLKKLNYYEHPLQLAAYAHGIWGGNILPDITGYNIFVDYEGHICHKKYAHLGMAMLDFQRCLWLWCSQHNYYPLSLPV